VSADARKRTFTLGEIMINCHIFPPVSFRDLSRLFLFLIALALTLLLGLIQG
jgi:hypothetical protein